MAKSRAIWIHDKIGVIFVPSISSHFIAVSLIFILKAEVPKITHNYVIETTIYLLQ